MQRVDEAAGLGRPTGFGTTYREQQFDASADEQDHAWSAEGEVASRAAGRRADKSEDAASAAAYVVGENQGTVSEAKSAYLHAAKTLMPFVRRSSHDHIRYVLGWLLLVMALAESPQVCSSNVPTRERGQVSGRRVPVVARRRVSVRAWWSRSR